MTDQGLQIGAAMLLLVAYTLTQLRVLHTKSLVYLLANMFGSEVLAVSAWASQQWAVLILEGAWSLISAAGLALTVGAVLDNPVDAHVALLRAPIRGSGAAQRGGTPVLPFLPDRNPSDSDRKDTADA